MEFCGNHVFTGDVIIDRDPKIVNEGAEKAYNVVNSFWEYTYLDYVMSQKQYSVNKITTNSQEDFQGAVLREHGAELSDFGYPWENETAPAMTFHACYDEHWLYCLFQVTDKNAQVYVNKNHKSEVLHSDRVEIFFRQDEKMNPYYCLEIDPTARVYDYSASYYRNFDDTWSWPSGQLKIKAEKTRSGYDVHVMIAIDSLNELGLIRDKKLQVGLFRGKCDEVNLTEDKLRWISWVKPDSESPDFHLPSAFGVFQLM